MLYLPHGSCVNYKKKQKINAIIYVICIPPFSDLNRLNNRTMVYMICNMRPCNITSGMLIIARHSESSKNYIPDLTYAISACIIS